MDKDNNILPIENTINQQKTFPTTDHCRHYLPHIEGKQYQMITFRLYDSVPKQVIENWKAQLQAAQGTQAASLRRTDDNRNQADCAPQNRIQAECVPIVPMTPEEIARQKEKTRQLLILLDKYEDAGYGQCFMKDERIAQIVYDNLQYHNHKRYELISWCIMPNHVHVLIELKDNVSIASILHSWRSYTSNVINKTLNRTGKVWMPEYFDRYIRDNEHYNKVIQYIHNNPVKAGLTPTAEMYRWSSAYEVDAGNIG